MEQVCTTNILRIHITSLTFHSSYRKVSSSSDQRYRPSWQEVIVGDIPIVTSMAPGGNLSFQGDLKKILPKAVQGLTPMKSILKFCRSLLA
jgi:hypothetical protein